MLSPADLLTRGLNLAPLDTLPEICPPGTVSAISGQSLAAGYPVTFVVTGATAERLDLLNGNPDGWVSDAEARCFKNNDPRQGMPTSRQCLIFEDGSYYFPLTAHEQAAKQGRPCWRDLVRTVWPERQGQQMLMLLSTDPKKRLWPYAVVGPLGAQTPVYVYGEGLMQTVYYDWPALIECLGTIEAVYARGFIKNAIRTGLLENVAAVNTTGLTESIQLEMGLRAWRSRPEFVIALLIAQREGDPK